MVAEKEEYGDYAWSPIQPRQCNPSNTEHQWIIKWGEQIHKLHFAQEKVWWKKTPNIRQRTPDMLVKFLNAVNTLILNGICIFSMCVYKLAPWPVLLSYPSG